MEMFIILGCLLGFFAGAAAVLATQRLAGGGSVSERRHSSRDQARLRVILQNVEAYDGTPEGQKELPCG